MFLCIIHWIIIAMYNAQPYFSLRNLGNKLLIIHSKIRNYLVEYFYGSAKKICSIYWHTYFSVQKITLSKWELRLRIFSLCGNHGILLAKKRKKTRHLWILASRVVQRVVTWEPEIWVGFFKDFIYLFLDRGEGRGKERERNNVWLPFVRSPPGTWPATQVCSLTGNQTWDPLVHRLALNPLGHTSQGEIWVFNQASSTY